MKQLFLASALLFPLLAAAPAAGQDAIGDVVVVCPVEGMIDEGIAVIVERAVREADEKNAKALILRVDTPGGRVDSAVKIASAIQRSRTLTIAYIEGMGAISAGALISMACDEIVMAPGSNIGAATPVIPTAEGMQPTGEKEVSFMRAKMRALAESNGHNPDVAQAMVDEDIELRGYPDENGEWVIYSIDGGESTDDADDVESAPDAPTRPKTPLEHVLENTGVIPAPAEPAANEAEEAEPAPRPRAARADDGSELVLASGKLLTWTPQEALKYGLIDTVEPSLPDVIEYFTLGEVDYVEIEPTWAEKTFRWLTSPTVASLLLLLALGGLYLEVNTPGFGIPGIVGGICLALFLGAHFVLGLTDVVDILLILLGAGLIILEMFVIPGFGIAGIAGILLFATGMYLALVDFTIPRYSWEFERLGEVAYILGLTLVLFGVFVFVAWKLLPHTPMYGHLVLRDSQDAGTGYTVQRAEDVLAYIGLRGTATSMLRPAGRGRFGEQTLPVVSHGEFIPPGTRIHIVEVEGNRFVVDRLQEPEAEEV